MDSEVLRQLMARRSVRAFLDKPVPDEVEDALYASVFAAPTACRQQLYSVIKISDPAKKQAMGELCDHQSHLAQAPLMLLFLADCQRWLELYEGAGVPQPRLPGMGDALWALTDAVIAAQNLVTAAHALGLGSCYLGDAAGNVEQVRELFALPEWVFPAALLAVGYPAPGQLERPASPRLGREALVYENRYPAPRSREDCRALFEGGQYSPKKSFEDGAAAFYRTRYVNDARLELQRSAKEYLKPFWNAGDSCER